MLSIVLYTILFFVTFFGMEFVAWFTHKYIMHGFLWFLHKDHHTGSPRFLERNDVFALIFAIPSWLFIMMGVINHSVASIIIGAGMTAYGLAYFTVHDVFTHQRLKWLRNSTNPYLMAVRRAHKMHHKHLERQKGESFGFLIVPRKYFKKSAS